ncbi:bile acid:sodium symporter [Silanimonas lenta]|uniref:bile acid:sodium symporter n=1 Tax=Silanimonas lenta TaxID=265429 RepID=UPI00041FD936|nr:bile acid:sodium symporter [Silanimonas lenta]
MASDRIERHQVWIYLAAILAGLGTGHGLAAAAAVFEALLWPAIALLLFATFVQVPLLHLREAFADRRFALANLLGNFLLLPLLVWGLLGLLPPEPALRLGVALVLLVPCTDWFITFTRLGGGDAARAIAISPLNLVLQLLLLPLYLWWLLPEAGLAAAFEPLRLLPAAAALLGLPLLAALLAERWIEARPERASLRVLLAAWPVPLLALVVFLIAAAQADAVHGAGTALLAVLPAFLGFLLAAPLLAWGLARLFGLGPAAGRTLAYGLGTRNSFVVLPFALALPAGWEAAALVIVLQSLVELLGMLLYLWGLPRWGFPATQATPPGRGRPRP